MTGTPMIEFAGFTDRQIEQFRRYQAVSYGVLDEVVAQLEPGVTERDATRWAMKAYRREGADRFFHLPVALFGERSALPEPWTMESFWPTTRQLEPGRLRRARRVTDLRRVRRRHFAVVELRAESRAHRGDGR